MNTEVKMNLEQFIMPTTERALDADEYVRKLRDDDRNKTGERCRERTCEYDKCEL